MLRRVAIDAIRYADSRKPRALWTKKRDVDYLDAKIFAGDYIMNFAGSSFVFLFLFFGFLKRSSIFMTTDIFWI